MEYWELKARESKIPRFKWEKILGMKLTKFLYFQFENGATKAYCLNLLNDKIRNYFARYGENNLKFSLEKVCENAKTSISARYAEYKRRIKI